MEAKLRNEIMTDKNHLTGGIIGELITGELPYWDVGICKVKYVDMHEDIFVYGEGGNLAERLSIDEYTDENVNLTELADDINEAVQTEMDEL